MRVADGVKRVRSSYRQQQAEATRLRIAQAAQELFATDGYGATSIDARTEATMKVVVTQAKY